MSTKIASLYAEIGAETSGFEKGAAGVKQSLGALVPGIESARKQLTGFISDNAGTIAILTGVGLAIKSAIDDTIKYAGEVRDLATVAGTGAEEASRLLQVLDDYQLTAQDVTAATRFMTQNGLTPSIETLAKLSDQYNAINDPMEKNKFILDNLGRGGLQWVNVLKQGGDALRAQSKELNNNLILTDKQVQAAEDARLAIDEWNDSIEAMRVGLSIDFLPTLTKLIDYQNRYTKAFQENANILTLLVPQVAMVRSTYQALTTTTEHNTTATDANSKATDGAGESYVSAAEKAKIEQDALKQLSDTYQGMIGTIQSMQDAQESYTKSVKDLDKERKNAEDDYQKALGENAKKSLDDYDSYIKKLEDVSIAEDRLSKDDKEYSEKYADLQRKRLEIEQEYLQAKQDSADELNSINSDHLNSLEEIKQKEAELADQRKKQALQFVSDILMQQLARDGWTQSEFDAFAKQQEAWGLWSADVVAQAKNAWTEADRLTASIDAVNPALQAQQDSFATWANGAQSSIGGVRGSIDELKKSFAESGNFAGFDRLDMAGASTASQPKASSGSGYVVGQSYGNATYLGAGVWYGHAQGGMFEVPPGYGNEGFRMGNHDTASAGELISITPKGQSPMSIDYDRMARSFALAVRDELQKLGR